MAGRLVKITAKEIELMWPWELLRLRDHIRLVAASALTQAADKRRSKS